MTMTTTKRLATKPLLSVEQTALLLGLHRSALYRSLQRGDLPLPWSSSTGAGASPAGPWSACWPGSSPGGATWPDGRESRPVTGHDNSDQPRSWPTCSAARRSSTATAPV